MRRFAKYLIIALLPFALINCIFFGLLIYLAQNDDLTYVNYASVYDKERRLAELSDSTRLVIIGGSNARYGFDCAILEDSLHLQPVNMAIHIGLGLNYMLDQVDTTLNAGDILVISPEYTHFLEGGPFYGDEGLTDMHLIKHQWLKAIKKIADSNNYNSIYRLIRRRVKRRNKTPDNIPADMEVRTKYNVYGDYTGHYDLPSKESWDRSATTGRPDKKIIETVARRVNSLQRRGVRVIMLPPPYAMSTYEADSILIDDISLQLAAAGIPFIMPPHESVYPDSLFYDSRYHLTHPAAIVHSKKLAGIISINPD